MKDLQKIEKIRYFKASLKDFNELWNSKIKDEDKDLDVKPLKESRAFLRFNEFIKNI